MGLDIYVGPLSRYYSGEWKTIIQQWGETKGVPVSIVTPSDNPVARFFGKIFSIFQSERPPVDPLEAIRSWRQALAAGRPGTSAKDWDWPEELDVPYETDKPDFDGHGAVQIWAAYAARPDLVRPRSFGPKWSEDSALAEATESPGPFNHIIGPELWLPVEFQEVFDAEDPSENDIFIGSVFELWRQMQSLNQITWNAPEEEIRLWREKEFDAGSLDSIARWGFSIWYCLAEYAVKNRLPMRLDY